jgi:dipeptidyl-peptidase-3
LAPYKGFINPVLLPVFDQDGQIADIEVNYGESYDHQMLRYSSEFGTLV